MDLKHRAGQVQRQVTEAAYAKTIPIIGNVVMVHCKHKE